MTDHERDNLINLINCPIQKLREVAAGFNCEYKPTKTDIEAQGFHNMTRGELVAYILDNQKQDE